VHANLSFTGRIATFSFRRKWLVIALWLAMLAVSGVAASGLGRVLTTENKDMSGSDSARARQTLDTRFGDQALVETLVVRSDTATVDDPDFQFVYASLAARLTETDGVRAVQTYQHTGDPHMVSADRHAALAAVVLADTEIKDAHKHIGHIADVVNAARTDGYQIHLVGPVSTDHELNTISEEDISAAEQFGLPVALIVMVLAFGAVLAAGVPLLLGIAAIGMAIGSVALIGRAFELSFFVTNIITMIGLAVGIDYSLFIIGRYREELAKGHDGLTAMGIAADSSGRAVFFSGITVLLALSGMVIVRNSIFMSIGIGAMVVVVYAVAASLTLLPAILGVMKGAINRLRVPFLGKAGYGTKFWGAVTRRVQRRPALFVIVSAGLLLAAALPLITINLGSNGTDTLPKETRAYQGVKALERDFSAGRSDPIKIVVDGDIGSPTVQAAIARLRTAVEARPDLQWVGVIPAEDGRTALMQVAPSELGTSAAAQRVVTDLRTTLIPQAFDGSGATAAVGGNLAAYVDIKAEMDSKLLVVFGFVLGLSFILLLLVFRSVAIPTKAILMNLLSVGAAYGLLVLVFQHGVGAGLFGFTQTPQIEFWIPLFLFSILFGLSMDYHVFLLSRVQEEYHRTGDNTEAVAHGVTTTAGMITSAAAIMVAVFGAFASGRMAGIQQMGFGLAVAVLLDATIIRSILVPASMQLLGRYNWWMPSWLGWLPRLSIEGGTPAPVALARSDPAYAAAGD
jgi:putative drug exporter of the RND superfamily